MTTDEMVDQALGRVAEVTDSYPSARGPMYRRLGYRQRQLFALAAQINPEHYGTCATAALVNGEADIGDIAEPVFTPELIQAVSIEDAGTSRHTAGDRVTIVRVDDMDAEVPPRALLRDNVLIGVGTDLDGVASVKISYPRLPALLALTDDTATLELDAPWDTLLELDLAKWILAKATAVSEAIRTAAIAALAAEEKDLLAGYQAHVEAYAPTVSRFTWPRAVQHPRG